jgi:prepilin-type N-terminal cleavage/methylation domain-containing protein
VTRARSQAGFTLIEVLLVCTLFLVITGLTLATFGRMDRRTADNRKLNDAADIARNAMDTASRQLRNLANYTKTSTATPPTIDTALPYDFIFQTSDKDKNWVRYCLDTSAPASPGNARLWQSEKPAAATGTVAPVTSGMRGPCPGTGWTRTRVVADHIDNTYAGKDRPVFDYACGPGAPAGCPSGSADYQRIRTVSFETFVDWNPAKRPTELRVSSSVYLRNQNEPPTASFTWLPSGTARRVMLNGSASSDPEGRTLTYYWFKTTGPTSDQLLAMSKCQEPTNDPTSPNMIGTGPTLSYTFPTGDASGSNVNIWLVVVDPGCLSATSTPQAVKVP